MKKQPLSLYRAILREHKFLPKQMKEMGDAYVQMEFKQHIDAEEKHLAMFYTAWENYLRNIRKRKDGDRYGRDLDSDTKSNLSDEQREKLKELYKNTTVK